MKAARVGDLVSGTCTCHTTPISTTGIIVDGQSNVLCEGSQLATVGSVCVLNCGHTAIVVTGATKVTSPKGNPARLGSIVTSPCFTGQIITSSQNVTVI